jgi:NADH-quinone oxidoreductase subunit H
MNKTLKIAKAIVKTARASFIPVGKQMIAYFMRPITYKVAPFVREIICLLKQAVQENVVPVARKIIGVLEHALVEYVVPFVCTIIDVSEQLIRENIYPITNSIYVNISGIFIELMNRLIAAFVKILDGLKEIVFAVVQFIFLLFFVVPVLYICISTVYLHPTFQRSPSYLVPLAFLFLILYFFYKIINFVALIQFFILVVPLLGAIAYFTLAERKILGAIQRRRGPNVVGAYGLLQPLADGFKLLVKETIIPSNSNKIIFVTSPILTFTLSLMGWAVIPYDKYAVFSQINLGLLYLFAVSSLGVYGVIMSGWSSNSKYAFLGSLRSAAQMVSYEISIGFIILTVAVCSGSFDLQEIIDSQKDVWFVVLFSPLALIFFICSLAETNRHPFDLPEAEAELVSGYNVEYSAMGFALFSLGEYCHMLLMSALNVTLFFGGWLPPFHFLSFIPGSFWFGFKIAFFVVLFIVVRAALPRYRYDQLMGLGWKVFFPISVAYLIITTCILECFNMMPY